MTVSPAIWAGFIAFILAMLSIDLFVFHREAHETTMREGLMSVGGWVLLGLAFTFVIWAWQGGTAAGEYISGYLIEYSLSVDNIFVFALLFSYFAVPPELQHRVLFWGIIGALISRAAFIAAGAALLESFHFMTYVFGAFLVFTGFRMARHGELQVHPERSLTLRLTRRLIPVTPGYRGERFFVRENGKRLATQLFVVLLVIEATDIVFAVDSIPAIFAVTRESFIVFSSNAFAILGLRALYFVLAGAMRRFHYLQIGLSIVLGFVGVKMLLTDIYPIPIWASLAFILMSLAVAVFASLHKESRDARRAAAADETPAWGGDAQEDAEDPRASG